MSDSDANVGVDSGPGLDTLVDLRIVRKVGGTTLSGVPSIILDPNKFQLERMMQREHLVYGVATRHIGRRTELELAYNAVRDSVNDERLQLVGLVGNAGVGKTRLLAEMFNIIEPAKRGVRVLSAVCSESESQDGLGVVAQLLRRRFEIGPQDSEQVARDKILNSLEGSVEGKQLGTMARQIGLLIGLRPDETPQPRGAGDTQQFRQYALRTFYNLFFHEANRYAHVLVFHRSQFMTERATKVLRGLVTALADTPTTIFLVGDAPCPDTLKSAASQFVMIDMQPLPPKDMERLVAHILQKIPGPPADLIKDIVERSVGSPRLAEDNIRLLVQRGVIEAGETEWSYIPGAEAKEDVTGTTGEAISQARVASLPEDLQHVLGIASVFGPAFWGSGLLSILRVRPASDTKLSSVPWVKDEPARWLEGKLKSAYKQDLLTPHTPPAIDGQREFSFTRKSERQAIYESLDPEDKAFYHRMAAQWLAGLQHRDPGPWHEIVAGHYEAGGRSDLAAEWLLKAAQAVSAKYDHVRAAGFFRRVLGLVDVDRMDLLLVTLRGLGECVLLRGDLEEAQRVGSAILEASLVARDRAAGAWGWLLMGRVTHAQGDLASARRCFDHAESLYKQIGDVAGLANVRDAVGDLLWRQTSEISDEDALNCFREGLELRRRLADPSAIAESLDRIAHVHLVRGEFKKALLEYEEALKLRRQVGDRLGEVLTLMGLGAVHFGRDQHESAIERWQTGLTLAERIDDRIHIGVLLNNIAESQIALGEYEPAQDNLSLARDIAAEMGHEKTQVDSQRNMARLMAQQGRWAEAQEQLEDAVRIARGHDMPSLLGQALRGQARLLSHAGYEGNIPESARVSQIRACFDESLQLFESATDVVQLLRTLQDYAKYLKDTGDSAGATRLQGRADRLSKRVEG